VTAFARAAGGPATRMDRAGPALSQNAPDDARDTTTPEAHLAAYHRLLTGDLLSPGSRDRLAEWMRGTQTSGRRFRAGVPGGWRTADRTGTGGRGATNDAGLLFPPGGRPLTLVVFSDALSDSRSGAAGSTADRLAGEAAVAEVTRRVVAAFA
jgi:beta-lactamase class A